MEYKLLSKDMTDAYCKKILMPEGATNILADMADRINNDKKLYDVYNKFYEDYITCYNVKMKYLCYFRNAL